MEMLSAPMEQESIRVTYRISFAVSVALGQASALGEQAVQATRPRSLLANYQRLMVPLKAPP